MTVEKRISTNLEFQKPETETWREVLHDISAFCQQNLNRSEVPGNENSKNLVRLKLKADGKKIIKVESNSHKLDHNLVPKIFRLPGINDSEFQREINYLILKLPSPYPIVVDISKGYSVSGKEYIHSLDIRSYVCQIIEVNADQILKDKLVVIVIPKSFLTKVITDPKVQSLFISQPIINYLPPQLANKILSQDVSFLIVTNCE